jgi:hypothetical protein
MKRYRDKYTEESSKYKAMKDEMSRLKRKYESTLENSHKL